MMESVIDFYCRDEQKELKRLVYPIMIRFGGISQKDYDDFYSLAALTLWQATKSYNEERGIPFEKYLQTCLVKKIHTMMSRRNTIGRACDRLADSLETPVGDDGKVLSDILISDFNLEEMILEHMDCSSEERIEKFLDSLSDVQRKMVELKMAEVPVGEIKKNLGLTNKQYEEHMKSIRQNRMITIFHRNYNIKGKRKTGGIKMAIGTKDEKRDMMDLDTTDNYRMDKYPLISLLEDKADGEIDCNYISQRQPFQWEDKQINKFYSRILNNQPIPEIVICETIEDGEKVSYLIDGLQRLSYAEEFRENRMAVKANGAEFVNVRYKDFEWDESGNKILDENGRNRFVVRTVNIVGKYYKDLPPFLQKRFDNFNINVTRFFDCSHEMINYHMRNYNNHTAMTKSQYGVTDISNNTTQNIKLISEMHPFFKNNVKCTNKNRKKGVLDETVARSIMAMYFMNDWKKDLTEVLKYIDKNATEEQFLHLKMNLDRLSKVADRSVQDLFNTTNVYIWLAVFHKFEELGVADAVFIKFMRAFKVSLHSKVINGRSYDSVNNRNTKDKATVLGKIEMITILMYDYLHT